MRKFSWLILLGVIVWSLTMIKSGIRYDYGMGFWGPNGHDGVWHVSLINSLSRLSWEMPIFAGERITNYHVGFDLLLAAIVKVTTIPAHTLYFQIIPPILALAIGLSVYRFVKIWQKSEDAAWWSVFLVYFGTSWGWLVSLVRNKDIGGESMFWAQQSISTLINPPFALSLVFIFLGLYSLHQKQYLRSIVFMALLSQIKVYAAILIFISWFIVAIWNLVKTKDSFLVKTWFFSLLLSLLIFLPLNSGAQSVLVWQPGWFLETMMGVSDRLNWPKFSEAMVNYRLGGNWPKATIAYGAAFAFFVLGNLGTRIVGVATMGRKDTWSIFILCTVVAGLGIPMFLLQEGTAWNTIQFSYYSLVFSSIAAGIAIAKLNNKFISAIVILSTVIGTYGTLKHYIPQRPPAQISTSELEALDFLSTKPLGTVFTWPFDKNAADQASNNPPRPLYLYESTAYVSAFSQKPVFMEDEVNLNITGFDWEKRRFESELIIESDSAQEISSFFKDNNIKYVYLLPEKRFKFGESQLGSTKIFDNGQFVIWQVNE